MGPGIQKAVQYLRTTIDASDLSDGDLLPNIAHLAYNAKVSTVTMWKAIRVLKEEGVVSTVRGQGIRVGSGGGDSSVVHPIRSRVQRWREVRNALEEDILNGTYPPGTTLPSSKILQIKYGASYATLREALDSLCGHQLLDTYKKSFMVPELTERRPNSCIVLLCYGNADGSVKFNTQYERECFITTENICSKSGISLQPVTYRKDRSGMLFYTARDGGYHNDIPVLPGTLGYIFWPVSPRGDDDARIGEPVMKRLCSVRLPVAVFEETGESTFFSVGKAKKNIRFFLMATGAKASRHISQYLLQLGHRRIAYITPFHHAPWSRLRYQSMQETYRAAGIDNGVTLFAQERFTCSWDYRKDIRPLYLPVIRKLREWLPPHIPSPFSSTMVSRRCARELARTFEHENLCGTLYPFFDRALKNRSISAWVSVNDDIACIALEYLRKKKIEVPGDISIISFDDSFEAVSNNITSYNFNLDAIGYAMVEFIINPQKTSHIVKNNCVEIQGMLNKRGSVSPRQ
jgi:DNA-binding transcriptional regulator YhcF (GntR family)